MNTRDSDGKDVMRSSGDILSMVDDSSFDGSWRNNDQVDVVAVMQNGRETVLTSLNYREN